MTDVVRHYRDPDDYDAVGEFLVRSHEPRSLHHNWLQPRWEYMHHHPLLTESGLDLGACGVWETEGRIVGVAHFEHRMGIVYLQIDPDYLPLRMRMFDYSERHLGGYFENDKAVHIYIDDADEELQAFARERGYAPIQKWSEPTTTMEIPEPVPGVTLPEPYRLRSLADEFDVGKIHRVMHRGFNHEGEPPEDELDARERKLSAPNFRRDLTIVAVAPDGNYASFCGIWLDSVNRLCYVEPVATDPDHRRLGLAKAVVLEAIYRCGRAGASIAYVGSDLPVYLAIGFEYAYRHTPWRKLL